MQLFYLTIVWTIFYVVQAYPSADYSETRIISETCEEDFLLSNTTRSKLDCGNTCGENPECRRFSFCSSDSTCKLYQHGTDCIMSGDSTSCTCYRKNTGQNGDGSTTCPVGYYGNNCQHVVEDCKDAFNKNIQSNFEHQDILTYIKPVIAEKPFEVMCELRFDGGMKLLNRKYWCSDVNFNRSMTEYEQGFGNIVGNYWIGFNSLITVMYSGSAVYTLQVMLFKADWSPCMIYYGGFQINSSSGYSFTSSFITHNSDVDNCGDSMTGSMNLAGNPFSTYDVDHTGTNKCASRLGGGWWFEDSHNCTRSFLTGLPSNMFWLDDLEEEVLSTAWINLLKN
ncbi:hypothetical protein SNE40_020638 [Patella caerulea]|uniref:Fibrinogen C-terminal domain-containing protein n=1 Tax=Patella caerulea TaxID=87958 RepID=A0AAN8PG15_PATCE